tara:strand:+ start:901 stop:1491 length:591 start_codon:yes stop_codon:yes gene_type:complete
MKPTHQYKKQDLPKNSFIQGWYMPEKVCDNLVNYFNKNRDKAKPGASLYEGKITPDKTIKDSLDLSLGNSNFEKDVFEYRLHLQEILDLYVKEYPEVERLDKFNVEDVNIQWYPSKGGFKTWHYERGAKENMDRVLVFMTYLNNVKNGGTHFKYQDVTTPAIKGLTVIWPPDWTHTHKGEISNDKKIIATGWFRLI